MTALPKKIPKEIYVPTEGTIKAEFLVVLQARKCLSGR